MTIKEVKSTLYWFENAADYEIDCGCGNKGWRLELYSCDLGRKLIDKFNLKDDDSADLYLNKVKELLNDTDPDQYDHKAYKNIISMISEF
jgi:hypothetical protein